MTHVDGGSDLNYSLQAEPGIDELDRIPDPDGANRMVIAARSLTRTFKGGIEAVRGIDLTVEAGEVFGFLGPNGAGKTTTVRMFCTLLPPTDGTATIAGYDVVRDAAQVRRRIGVALQEIGLDPVQTGRELLELQCGLYGITGKRAKARAQQLLELVGLTDAADRFTKTYSGGMKRRLDLASALVHQPEVLFLDEPTTGLDPVSRVAVWEMLGNIKAKRQLTILITTHYMDEADRLCDRIAIVDHGKLVALDTPPALKASVPGSNVIEAQFDNAPPDWEERLKKLSGVTSVQHEGAGMYRILTGDGSRTTTQLVESAVQAGVKIRSLSVQNTTLDDVFVHYTGRQLRDELQKAYAFVMPQRPGLQP